MLPFEDLTEGPERKRPKQGKRARGVLDASKDGYV